MTNSVIGLIGFGHLGEALARGYGRAGWQRERLLVAPHDAATASRAKRAGASVVADMAALVSGAKMILLCVRPDQAEAALSSVPFRPESLVVSTLAGVPLSRIAALSAPARAVRTMPMTAAAWGRSPTALYPDDAEAKACLAPLGPVLPLARESDLDIWTAGSILYTVAHLSASLTARWLEARGFAPDLARDHAIETLAAASVAMERNRDLAVEHLATPGGVAAAALSRFDEGGFDALWETAFDAGLARIAEMGTRHDPASRPAA